MYSMTIKWLIVGGGVHGTHISARLIGEAGVNAEHLRILEPGNRLLSRWRMCTARTGMTHLRSPSVHHLDLDPWSLRHFVGAPQRGDFAAPYHRPSLRLFNDHCERVIETFGLASLHIQERARHCSIEGDGVVVHTDAGRELRATNLVLALGVGDELAWPEWAPIHDARIQHIFDESVDWPLSSMPERIAVVGGGITACQVALRLAGEGHQVSIISRHGLRTHQFDSDPGWLGPKHYARFSREPDVGRRRQMISAARYRGSVPPEIRRAIRRSIRTGTIQWFEASVRRAELRTRAVHVQLVGGTALRLDRLFLATGFSSRRPGGTMLDRLIKTATLPVAPCGYPIVDRMLRWHPRVYVCGALAELELGPVARNIAGARRAGDRLVQQAMS